MLPPPPRSTLFPYTTLFRSLDAPPTIPVAEGARALPAGPGAVRFENVTFGYDPEKPVIKDVSFEVAGGKVVRSEEHTSELQSQSNLVCRLLLEKKKKNKKRY